MDYHFRAELTFGLPNGGSSLFDLGEKGALAAPRVKQMHHLILDLKERSLGYTPTSVKFPLQTRFALCRIYL
jgi:hypothetical protein